MHFACTDIVLSMYGKINEVLNIVWMSKLLLRSAVPSSLISTWMDPIYKCVSWKPLKFYCIFVLFLAYSCQFYTQLSPILWNYSLKKSLKFPTQNNMKNSFMYCIPPKLVTCKRRRYIGNILSKFVGNFGTVHKLLFKVIWCQCRCLSQLPSTKSAMKINHNYCIVSQKDVLINLHMNLDYFDSQSWEMIRTMHGKRHVWKLMESFNKILHAYGQ